jgi:hypothetical protein
MVIEPQAEFRPVESRSTLKPGGSAAKPWARVRHDWATHHYIGYLQGFDSVEERQPSQITISGNEIIVWSREGLVGRYEVR